MNPHESETSGSGDLGEARRASQYDQQRDHRGDLAGALKSYRDGLAIAERLAQSDPSNAGWQRHFSISHGRLAISFKKTGETAKALAREEMCVLRRRSRPTGRR
jgi:hypothetical protein